MDFDMDSAKAYQEQLAAMAANQPMPPRQPTALQTAVKQKIGVAPEPSVTPQQRNLLQELFQQQSGDVQQLRQAAEDYEKKPLPVDMRSLASVVDMWTGGNAASGFAPSTTPEEKQMNVAKLRALAGEAQRDQTKEQIGLITSGDKNDTSLLKTALAGMIAGQNKGATQDWRTDRVMAQAADSIHKAPNMRTYTDMANSVGESMFLVNKPDVTITEAHEALQNLTRAIGRTNVSSDYRQKQLAMPTVQESLSRLQGMITSDPNQPAPPETLALIKKIGGRVLDTYDSSIKREANRSAQGKLGKYRTKEANQSLQEARDFYTRGDYMKELREQYGLEANELPQTDKNLKSVATPVKQTFNAKQIEAAAKKSGQTVDQIKAQLKAKKYGIEGE